ncbi:MAG: hypothetical protein M0Q51_13890 [Bacteroidales bacterium]|nr:hypothetical protein [Bacteroidales bacterium]
MKSLILSFLLIFGLASPNIGKPINDIYSIKEPDFAEEAYVNDIPFDTRAIAGKYLLRRMMETSDEANVNDIPFNTEKILYEELAARLTDQYRNEKSVFDIPGAPDYIICLYQKGVPYKYIRPFF